MVLTTPAPPHTLAISNATTNGKNAAKKSHIMQKVQPTCQRDGECVACQNERRPLHIRTRKTGKPVVAHKPDHTTKDLHVHTYCTRTAVVLAAISEIIGSWSVSTYRMSMYASANSCIDRRNTEGGRDPASRLTKLLIRGRNGRPWQRQTSKSRKGWGSSGEK